MEEQKYFLEDKEKYKKRELNIELLRIVLMFFIIAHHIVINEFNLTNISTEMNLNNTKIYFIGTLFNSLVIIGVNVFFLISGYFKINFRLKKVIYLFGIVFFYSFILVGIDVLLGFRQYNWESLKVVIFSLEQYWFIYVYIFLMLLSPFLNKIIEHTKKEQAKFFIFIIFAFFSILIFIRNFIVVGVNNGYSLISACYLYLIGAWIKKYNFFSKIKSNFIFYIIFSILNWGLCLITIYVLKNGEKTWHLFSYNNPLIILSSICFFKFFYKLKINYTKRKANIIIFFSKSILAIYIIHGAKFIGYIAKTLSNVFANYNNLILAIFFVATYAVITFVICLIIDKLLKLLFDKYLHEMAEETTKVMKKIYNKIVNLIC